MSTFNPERTPDFFNRLSEGHLPGLMGLRVLEAAQGVVRAELQVRRELFAPNGFLHAGTVVTLADTACGYGCVAHLPEGGKGFTTIELKSNHLGTARDGTIEVEARGVHLGRSTQVWDATVRHRETGKTIALFRCTQMIL
ncbi:PaaI family thioesterase [Ramlibacter sp.]|uniref:PaaI family thioesterase n=1 Tax=Ramlibacter sp. TaxID=1917967 RepID=UPI0017CD7C9D|nr:PaaI family thioesterase [Ramlibacter sp.]MBA2674508.1 PaaI family thioesterase [Ramlibacter sp.]